MGSGAVVPGASIEVFGDVVVDVVEEGVVSDPRGSALHPVMNSNAASVSCRMTQSTS